MSAVQRLSGTGNSSTLDRSRRGLAEELVIANSTADTSTNTTTQRHSRALILFLTFCILVVSLWWCMGASSSHNMASAPVVVPSTAKHTATVIFLHGLGDTGHGWSEAFKMIRHPHIRYVCPTAPVQPVSLNAGFRMPSWFDIKGLTPDAPEDEAGITKATENLQHLIADEEKLGIPRSRIIVGGFSQGGAVALYSALTEQKKAPLAGLLTLSTWMPLHKKILESFQGNKLASPVLQCHGMSDNIVPFQWGDKTAKMLKEVLCQSHEFKIYKDMSHSSCNEEMQDVKTFIEKYLQAN